MVKESKCARPVSGNELSLQSIARNYVVHVFCVKENDPNFGIPCISSTKVWSSVRLVRRTYQKWNPICPSMEM